MSFKRGISLLLCLMLLWTSAFAFAEGTATPPETDECEHSFNDDGVCKLCRYACPHPTESRDEKTNVIGDGTAIPQDENTHLHVYTLHTKRVTCSICGAVLEDDSKEQSEPERHSFDESGLCACGYRCPHAVHDVSGACTVCKAACEHSYNTGTCEICGLTCTHKYVDGRCTICGADCQHPQDKLSYINPQERVNRYTLSSTDGHIVCYDVISDAQCTLCGMTVQTGVVTQANCTRHEEHTLVDGRCTVCGKEPCSHYGLYVSNRTENHVYKPVDAQYHTDTYDVIETKFCEYCYTIFDSETKVIEQGRVDQKKHDFNSNGICSACGYQNGCAHANTSIQYELDYSSERSEKLDETYHMTYWQTLGYTYCVDCGMKLEQIAPVKGEESKKQKHYVGEDGVCYICRAEGVCTHPAFRTEEYYESYTTTFVDETYCSVSGIRRTIKRCSICGKILDDVKTEIKDEKMEHSFYQGHCSRCQYVPKCAHEKAYVEMSMQRLSETPKDDKVHTVHYNLYELTYCAYCNAHLDGKLIEQNCEKPEAHSASGKCSCGYINTCKHENIKKDFYDSDGMYATQIDAKTHYLEWDSYSYDICADCGADLGNEQFVEHVKIAQMHDFEDGVCCDCGYESGCQHANTYTEKYSDVTACRKLNEKYHKAILNWYEAVRCADCGEYLSRKVVETGDEMLDEHVYNDLGVCNVCNYVNTTCKHENVAVSTRWDWAQNVTASDENGHTITKNAVKVTRCQDCGYEKEEVLAENMSVTEPHWDNGSGYCDDCGYALGGTVCKHEHTEEDVSYQCQSVLSADDNGHKIRAIKATRIFCEDCGALLRLNEEPNQTVTGEHEYYLDRCVICDYKNPCKHGTTHTEEYYSRVYNCTYTAESHTFKADLWEYTVCEVCNSVIAEKLMKFDGTFTEKHDLENGVCEFCGYKAPAQPTPGPTAKPSNDTDNTFVPTPRPQNRVTEEPVIETTPEPAPQAMVDTLLGAVLEAQAEGSTVDIEVVGAKEIMTETEYTALRALPAQEQILVTLASIGFEDVVEAAMKTLNVTLSEDAQTLVAQVTERMAAVPEEERAALEEKLAQYFPIEEVIVDGVRTSYFVIDLRIEVDGVERVERYGFRLDENGEWIFVKLDLQSVAW